MRLVLDANEYIYALGSDRKPACQELLLFLAKRDHPVRVVRTIVGEVIKHTPPRARKLFFEALASLLEEDCEIDEEFVIPYHRGEHYREVGFKQADALIAAYTEAVEAEVLISENRRHFHEMADRLPFHVMDAESFLKSHRA